MFEYNFYLAVVPFFRRRQTNVIHDPDHEKAEREARLEAAFDALLVRLWGSEPPHPPPIRLAQPRPLGAWTDRRMVKNPVVGDWRDRMRETP